MIMSHDGPIKVGDTLSDVVCSDLPSGCIIKIRDAFGAGWVKNKLFIINKRSNNSDPTYATCLNNGQEIRNNTFKFDCEIIRI